MKKQKLHLIFNPNSGKGKKRGILETIKNTLADDFDLDLIVSTSRKMARDTAQEITKTRRNAYIAVAGGDGTINDVLNGCDLSSGVTMGLLPTGTVNIVAKELGIPETVTDACACLKNKIEKPVDVSVANKIRFLFGAGIGFDADIIENVDLKQKLVLGKGVYALNAFKLMSGYKPFPATVSVDGKVCYEGTSFEIIVGKSKYYAGKFLLFPDASFDNGLLDIAIFAHQSKPGFAFGCVKFFLRARDAKRFHFQGKTISIKTQWPVAYHVDGDTGASAPVDFRIEKEPLRLVVAS